MSENGYKYLEPRPRSSLRQLWVKGRNIWAEVLYRETVGEDSRTPEKVAHDFGLPVEAVREAIDYCTRNADFLNEERQNEYARITEMEKKHPPLRPLKS